jgi:protein-S-isoprenylcysteine O-methyltransferase Ste14
VFQAWIVTAFPVLFLIVLFGGGAIFRRRNIDMDGNPPIGKALFLSSKYLIVILWVAMVIHNWGVKLSFFDVPAFIKSISLGLWVLGFALLFTGRFGLGESFRIGSPRESTGLKMSGLFRFSRNPMYLGVFTTLAAVDVNTLNPLLLFVAIYIIAVHHIIVLAEEEYLMMKFGEQYQTYFSRVRRYI